MTTSTDVNARAILSRFGFNKRKAIQYCQSLGRTYPNLAQEYTAYGDAIHDMDVAVMEELNG